MHHQYAACCIVACSPHCESCIAENECDMCQDGFELLDGFGGSDDVCKHKYPDVLLHKMYHHSKALFTVSKRESHST